MVIPKMLVVLVLVLPMAVVACPHWDPNNQPSFAKLRVERDIEHCGPNDPLPPNRVNTTAEVAAVRTEMARLGLGALVVPMDEEGRLKWLSGFAGSAGQVVVTAEEALLWTDGRYFLAAADQLDCQWRLMRQGEDGVPGLAAWVAGRGGGRAGADAALVGAGQWLEWADTMGAGGVTLEAVGNLIDLVWTEANGRPPTVHKDLVVHGMEYAGEAWEAKVDRVREELVEQDMFGMVVTEHDELAWLLNLRGEGSSHVEGLYHSPTFQGLALLTLDSLILWVHSTKVGPEVRAHLSPEGCQTCVEVRDLELVLEELALEVERMEAGRKVVVTRPSTYLQGATYDVYNAVEAEHRELASSPILGMKAIKNQVEVDGMVASHARDSAALCSWAAMMEEQVEVEGAANWTEISAAEELAVFRAREELSRGSSFGTISAFGTNGAIIHYSATPETDKAITTEGLFMVDSGGQYLDGTTDVTRTFHYGRPTEEEVERYTQVLQGAVELARLVVPDGTLDSSVDLATRQFLYRSGLDYRHGTGHGIGAYLEVHEGPTLIRMANKEPSRLRPGMFFSDEPGFYKDGQFGLRLETILRAETLIHDGEFGSFLHFLPVTLVPFEPKLIKYSMLSPQQIDWINGYNQLVLTEVAPRLMATGDGRGLAWVEARTAWVDPRTSHVFTDTYARPKA